MKRWLPFLAAIVALACPGASTRAGTVEDDWQAIVALDAGPKEQPKTPEAAGTMVLNHLAAQEKVLRGFIAAHPEDAHLFEARLRLARLLQIRADFESSEKPRVEARRILEELNKTATPEQRPELDFAKVARQMRTLHRTDAAQCAALLQAARRFQKEYPSDRRVAALLTEVAGLFDAQPATKEALLEDAQAVATDEELKSRIADDLTRVRLLGKEVALSFTSLQGEEIKIEALFGHPVFLVFFGGYSPPAVAALGKVQQAVTELPAGSVRVVAVSVDLKREALVEFLKSRGITWPVAFDGKGWQGPLVRGLGINAVPTVWLLDARGRLRSLNGLDGAAAQARQLLREH